MKSSVFPTPKRGGIIGQSDLNMLAYIWSRTLLDPYIGSIGSWTRTYKDPTCRTISYHEIYVNLCASQRKASLLIFTKKIKIKRIELPTHYSEVNHRKPKAVVSYGPNIGHTLSRKSHFILKLLVNIPTT
ncbi:ribosomal protein S4, putative [Medicago truncatula]|uniref:Ribosomal protein S4, putative n=1 Tax=Medicago truncatula TaxID=3880 RepID=G7ZUG5_MEDTR|nr:ribosomal protein S4, putative [Medicago truncatula]